jgi:hypothetical protein
MDQQKQDTKHDKLTLKYQFELFNKLINYGQKFKTYFKVDEFYVDQKLYLIDNNGVIYDRDNNYTIVGFMKDDEISWL